MDEEDEDLSFFLPKPAPRVDLSPVDPDPEGEPEDFLGEVVSVQEDAKLPPPEDPEAQFEALLRKFPQANQDYLRRVVSEGSAFHVEAMLKPKSDARADALLHRILRQSGSITTNERAEVKGHGVDWAALRDAGLVIDRETSAQKGNFLYTLRLDAFEATRGTRETLTGRDRKRLFEAHNFRCNRVGCGSGVDLQADHRIGVVIAGTIERELSDYQALCRVCNLNKRVACGKCPVKVDPGKCQTCSWAFPERAEHTAGEVGQQVTFRLRPGVQDQALQILHQHGFLMG